MKTDQNARMHNTLSDLSMRRLSCEQTEMILKNYGKENNRGSEFCMRMQQTDAVMFYDVPYHKKIASKHKQRKLQLVGASVRHIRVSATRRNCWQFSVGAYAVQSFQFVDTTRSFLQVNGSKSAIRCILRSVSKPTLVIFGTFEVGKAYRIDLIL